MISEGNRNNINFAIPVLEHIDIDLTDRVYDSSKLIDYIYDQGGEQIIPLKNGAKFERLCDRWLYKERHLGEKLLLKLKSYRRIATMTNFLLHILALSVLLPYLFGYNE